MALPLFFIVALGMIKVGALATAAKGATWTSTRFFQHGFDIDATVTQLTNDLRASKEFGVATRDLLVTLHGLRETRDFVHVTNSAHTITRFLGTLPGDMRTGLNKSINLGARIDTLLQQATARCAKTILHSALSVGEHTNSQRIALCYFGLLLLGRSGQSLTTESRATIKTGLAGLHEARRTPSDQRALAALEALHAADVHTAIRGFSALPEVTDLHAYVELNEAPLWIMKALGSEVATNPIGTFLFYLTTFFPEVRQTTVA